jgi:hypothetical protein
MELDDLGGLAIFGISLLYRGQNAILARNRASLPLFSASPNTSDQF